MKKKQLKQYILHLIQELKWQNQLRRGVEEVNKLNVIELEDTIEALRRCRNLLNSERSKKPL